MKSIILTHEETERYQDCGPEGDKFRRETWARARAIGGQVEIYSDDGIVFEIATDED